jgi:hypothetical protein
VKLVAAWLVARPQNAVLALAATLLLPLMQVFSGAIMVLLVLQQGVRLAVIEGLLAGGVLALVALFAGAPAVDVVLTVTVTLLPAALLGLLLQASRSLVLTMQVTAILAAVAMLGFQLAVSDPVAFWQPMLTVLTDWARDNQLYAQAELLESEPRMAADMMSLAAVVTRWTLYAIYLLLGYRAFSLLMDRGELYGRFRDLDFGRVIGLTLVVASVVAWALGLNWLQNVAVVLFAVFWVQGLAIMHWLHGEHLLPTFVVGTTYALMLILHIFLIIALAVFGYTDAWFGFRRRAAMRKKG